MATDNEIEQEIKDKGLTAPRVTPEHIKSCIVSEHYFTAADGVDGADIQAAREKDASKEVTFVSLDSDVKKDGTPMATLSLLTFCVLVLRNGFTVTGESACVSPENFDAEIGKKIARDNAVQKIWMLEGYALKDRLHAGGI